ncbi:MAG TPA: type I-B CRISPR-associated protein Cas7/Cst2/DevR [Urbifossiella sp.]|jgi:CRISPR-associated protein Cst2|nr:type I-B CRISPR-associated protein Cas7/Cst2/DevR [Urbifossiella sp.]
MSLHVFANFVTPFGVAANNRAEAEGNIATLQKLLWMGETHTTVSAEAIRFALRRRLAAAGRGGTNRTWDEAGRANAWADPGFGGWADPAGPTFIDDDLLGYMRADAAKDEGEAGSATVRRGVLEVTRAVSVTPWAGDVTFNAASPGAAPAAAGKPARHPVPYGTEVHATRYQYGVALTPARLRDPARAAVALDALCALGPVAGNHGRFLFDFSPDAVVFRVTADPAPRLLYCFESGDHGRTVVAPRLADRVRAGDVDPAELIVAGVAVAGAAVAPGVKAACAAVAHRLAAALAAEG